MQRQIAINSHSTGKFSVQQFNGRDHIVTRMVSLEADSVMNGLAYPREAVQDSYMQLDALPAPASHPLIAGEHVSASHPMAVNAFNIGAMVMNPALEGDQVFNDLVIDKSIAEKDERGVELIRRIENGERIGVSTGLSADIINNQGEMKGRGYNGMVSNIKFDHVAILLNEPPAGQNTYTVNSDEKAVIICNVDQSAEQKTPAVAPISTKRKGISMELENLVNAVIVNSNSNLTEANRETLMGLNENALVSMVCANSKAGEVEPKQVTVDEAISVVEGGGMFAINSDEKALLDGLKAGQVAKRDAIVNSIVEKSEMTAEQLANMDMGALESLAKSVQVPVANFSVQGAAVTNADKGTATITLHEEA